MDFSWISKLIRYYELIIIPYFYFANFSYLIILILGFLNARKLYLETKLNLIEKMVTLKSLTPISILMPAYNEEKSIIDSVYAMLRMNYPDFEVLVCNDGSTDRTIELLISEFSLFKSDAVPPQLLPSAPIRNIYLSSVYSNLVVLDKENGGKADALNAGINLSQNSLICCVDADSLLDSDGLMCISLPFFEDPELTIATGGTICMINTSGIASKNISKDGIDGSVPWTWIGMIQGMEYLRAFLVGRMGWDYLGCTTIISGALGLFKKEIVLKVGGYTKGAIGEDMELLLRMHNYCLFENRPYRVKFLPDPVCWTEAPSDLSTLGKQRSRWQQGLCDSLWRNRESVFNRKGKWIGMVALPYQLLFETISAPMEVLGYVIISIGLYTGVSGISDVLLFFGITVVFGGVLNLGALIIDQLTFKRYSRPQDIIKLIIGAILEQVGYRQIHLYWRIRGIYRWLAGKHVWGEKKRRGFNKAMPQK